MFKNYLIIALRNLSKNKVYAFINIAGLSIGLACSMLIILYVKDEVSYDRFHSNVKNIYRIVKQNNDLQGHKTGIDGNTGYFQGPRFTKNVGGIQSFVRVQSGGADVKHETEVSYQELLYADSNFFSVFSFPLKYGDKLSCLKDPHSVVLSEDAAKKQFGTADAVGKTMILKKGENFEPYIVSAVAKKTQQNSSIQFEMLLPLIVPEKEEQDPENWFHTFLNTFVVLSPNVKVPVIETGMQKFYTADSRDAVKLITEKYGPMQSKEQYHLQPYAAMHLSTELPAQNGLGNASNPMYSYILSGIALFILLIACINFVNLTIARSVKRAKEIGIRKVVGGQRKQLILQFLGESFLLCFIAFFFAVLLVKFLLPLFNDLSNKALALSYLFDVKLVAGYVLLFAVTAFLAGFYPALVLSGYNPVQTLYSRFNLGGKNYLQRSLVVLQFALASFLIIATFTIYSQFNYLTNEKLGYDDSHLVKVDKQTLTRDEAKLFRSKLKENPNIVSITAKNSGYWGTGAKVNGDSAISFAYETIDEDFLPSLKIALKEGRNFSRDYTSDSSQSIIVNESFVKMAGWKKALGQEVNFFYENNKKYSVIGVVKDYHFQPLNQKIGPQLFTMKKSNEYGTAFIKIKPGSERTSIKHIEEVFRSLFPLNPFKYVFKDEENIKNYESEAKWKQIMLFSAILTIFISCIGLFGLSVLSAEKRTKEIGIRKVLGASVQNVVSILSKDFIKLVIIALLIAIPVAWLAANKWLENYPYRMPLSWSMFAAAALLVITVGLFTVSFQALKAAVANPVKSLRTE